MTLFRYRIRGATRIPANGPCTAEFGVYDYGNKRHERGIRWERVIAAKTFDNIADAKAYRKRLRRGAA